MHNEATKVGDPMTGLIRQLGHEIDEEQSSSLGPEDAILADVARRILKLERDLTIPGSSQPQASRIERLSMFIQSEAF
jgi:hypothetical protein